MKKKAFTILTGLAMPFCTMLFAQVLLLFGSFTTGIQAGEDVITFVVSILAIIGLFGGIIYIIERFETINKEEKAKNRGKLE